MSVHEKLLAHPQPVDKTAALHIAGGDKLGRDEMLWAQHEAFERALTEARLHNMETEQTRRLSFARDEGKIVEGFDDAKAKHRELVKKHPRSFATKDWSAHMNKLRNASPHYRGKMRLGSTRSDGRHMDKFVKRVTA